MKNDLRCSECNKIIPFISCGIGKYRRGYNGRCDPCAKARLKADFIARWEEAQQKEVNQ